MPELAPIQTQPPHSCPTAEDLACYIDGALSPQEAARVTEHLASCESCFEVYSGVLEFQLESEPVPVGKVVPFPTEKPRQPVAWWTSIAAFLVVGVGVGGYSYFLASPPALVTAELTTPLQGKADIAENRWRRATRGPGDETGDQRPEETAFKLGVQILNLRASLEHRDSDTASDVIAYILTALKEQPSGKDLEESFEKMKTTLLQGKAPGDFLGETARLSQDVRDFSPRSFDLGQWVEAGYLAAISHDSAFFGLPASRSFLRQVLWRDRLGLESLDLPRAKESRGELNEIYKIAGQSTLQPSDFKTLKGHFEKILEANYPQ
jgi:hypothetical protein